MAISIDFDAGSHAPFLVSSDAIITKGQWTREVFNCAAQLEQHTATRWLLHHDNFHVFSVYFFSLLLAGKQVVLPNNGQPEKLMQLKEHFDAALLPKVVDGLECWLPSVDESGVFPKKTEISPEQSIVLFTSGSSGEAKKIEKQWRQLTNEVVCQSELWRDTFSDRLFASTVSHQHIYGLLFKLLIPHYNNVPVYSDLVQFPEQVGEISKQFDGLTLIASPAFLNRVSREKEDASFLSNIGAVFSSGGPLAERSAKQLYRFIEQAPIELYGSTETGGIAWRQYPEHTDWQVLPGLTCQLSDARSLQIRSPFLADDTIYTTDDRAQMVSSTRFVLKGRVDRVVKIEEKRLSLDELESLLEKHALCSRAKALLLGGERAQLAVVIELARPDDALANKERINTLKAHLKGYLELVLVPKKWRFVESFPVTLQGKTPLSMLEELFR